MRIKRRGNMMYMYDFNLVVDLNLCVIFDKVRLYLFATGVNMF